MDDLAELVTAEEEARMALVYAAFAYDDLFPRAFHNKAIVAYRTAVERRVRFEEEAKRAGLIAYPWMAGAS